MRAYLDQETLGNSIATVYDILEKTGVRFESGKACELFREHGAEIEGDIVRMPRKLVDEALEAVPKMEYGEAHAPRIAGASLFSDAPFIIDEVNGSIRRCTVSDQIKMYKLNDTSEIYEMATPGCADPEDIHMEDGFVAQIAMLLKYSVKYPSIGIRATASNSRGKDVYGAARRGFRLVREFYDTWDEPVLSQGICPNPPLTYDKESLENLQAAIDEKQAIGISPCTLSYMTGPERIMDLVIHDFAMALAGVCYIGLAAPGLDVSISEFSASSDIRTVQPVYSCAESLRLQVIFYELARYFSLPCSICGCYGDGVVSDDYQAGMEAMLTMLQPFRETELDELWCYPGHLAGFSCGSFRKAILDEEAIRLANRALRRTDMKIRPDLAEYLAAGRAKAGFLTLGKMKNYKEDQYMTAIFDKGGVAKAMNKGTEAEAARVVKDRVDQILQERFQAYEPPALTAAQKKLLEEFLPAQCR